MIRRIFVLVVCLAWTPLVAAQTPTFRHELLSLLPDDFAVCVAMHDLRGQSAAWERSDWFKAFRKSPLGMTLLDAPELKQFDRWQVELKKHFNLDWPGLRDDILGDTVLFAFSPGPTNRPEDERGLILIHVARPEKLALFIDRLNELQKKSGELKSLTPLKHRDMTYHRREQADKSHYYLLDGSLAVVATREEMIRAVIDRQATARPTAWTKRFQRAGADGAFVTMALNPREIKPDFVKARKDDPRKDDHGYWQALQGIFVTFTIHEEAALRISIQADADRLPKWTRTAFLQPSVPSELWQRFPEPSICTIASRTDIAGLVDGFTMLLPEKDRKNLAGLGALFKLDLFKDVLPNLGPDWGLCMLPARDARQFPQVMVALAVKPGMKDPPVDHTLFNTIQLFANIALIDFNKKHAEPIRMQTMVQGKVEVKYLTHDKLFPPGFQPACALKEGFLVFASSPDAILSFRKRDVKAPASAETPMFRLSTHELARLIQQREGEIVASLKERHGMADENARQNLRSVVSLLELFEQVTLSQHADAGQASWTLRLRPSGR